MSEVPQGYLPPESAYLAAPEASDPHNDPLVTPQGAGIGGWFTRFSWLLQRGWQPLAMIFALTHVLPAIVLNVGVIVVVSSAADPAMQRAADQASGGQLGVSGLSTFIIGAPFAFIGTIAVAFVAVYFLQSVGYAAATHSAVRRAVGAQSTIGESLAYGLRRSPGLFGWTLLFGLGVGLGALACLIPGIYLTIAWALFGPAFLFERTGPISRSFGLFNNNRGQVLGRLAMTYLFTLVGGFIISGLQLAIEAAGGGGLTSTQAPPLGLLLGTTFLGAVLTLPITIAQFGGVLLTYTEQRGREGVGTHQLVNELG